MASEGPNYPGTAASLANAGTSENANAWTSASSVGADDGSTASITAATYDATDISELLVASNFGFSIPAGSTIDGIVVEIDRNNVAGAASDNRVQLATGTTFADLVGDNKADTATDWPGSLASVSYGASTDTWNAGLTAAQVNSSSFAVMLSVQADAANTDIAVDYIRVTVYYTEGELSDYATEVVADSPVAWWRMGEASGNPQDSSGSNHVTSTSGTPTYSVAGAITGDADTAITLDGSSEAFSVPDHASLDLGDVFTIEAWVKRAGNGTEDVILSKGTNAYILFLDTAGALTLSKRFVADIVASTTTITDTEWHHCVATKNGSTVALYIDGVDVTGTVSNQTLSDTTSALTIGQDNNTWWFNGSLDEIALYNTALSSTRVAAHYTAAAGAGNASAGLASATGAAQQPAAKVAPAAAHASATGAANSPAPRVAPNAGAAAATGAAYGLTATIQTTGGNAAATATAQAPSPRVAPSGGHASAVAAAFAAAVLVAAGVGHAAATAAAYDATISTSGAADSAPAELASATGEAHSPSARVAPTGGLAAATGAAQQPSASVKTNAGNAAATAAAATPAAGISPTGGHASATGAAYAPTASLSPSGAHAAATAAAAQPAPSVAPAGAHASATAAAYDATVSTGTVVIGDATIEFTQLADGSLSFVIRHAASLDIAQPHEASLADMANEYDLNDSTRPTVTFTVSDAVTDPTTVTLTVIPPDKVPIEYTYAAGGVTKSSTGVYYKDITLTQRGIWFFRYVGTGTCAAAVEGTVTVRA